MKPSRLTPHASLTLESVSDLYSKSASITRHEIFDQEIAARIAVAAIQKVVNAAGDFHALEKILTKQGEVYDPEASSGRISRREPAAGVLEFQAGKEALAHDRRDEVELAQMFRRIGRRHTGVVQFGILQRVARAPAQAGCPEALQLEFDAL